jgi:RNA polymerase sigma factor (sigma-70 family)
LLHFERQTELPLPLEEEEQMRLFQAYIINKPKRNKLCLDIENKLISHNLRLAEKIASKYYLVNKERGKFFIELSEYKSLAQDGLICAVKGYNPNLGWTFGTYATRCIKNKIHEELRTRSLKSSHMKPIQPAFDEDEIDFENLVISPDCVEDIVEQIDMRRYLKEAMNAVLNNREKTILCLYYGFTVDGIQWKYEEIASMLGMKRPNVSQIAKKARGKLKDYLEAKHPCN